MPVETEISRIFHPDDRQIASAILRLSELRTQRETLEVLAFDPLHFDPLIRLLEFPAGALMQRFKKRIDRLQLFWRYKRILRRRCRALTETRLQALSNGLPVRVALIAEDDEIIRLSLRRMNLAAVLYLFGFPEAIEMARVSRDELIQTLRAPTNVPA